MRLILGTFSAEGVEVFRDVQQSVEKSAIATRDVIQVSESGQPSLFPTSQIVELEAGRLGVGCPANRTLAADTLVEAAVARPGSSYRQLAATVMEKVPVRRTHLNEIAMSHRREGVLRFDLPSQKRTPLPDTRIYPVS